MSNYKITVNPSSEFACSIQELAEALRAEVISENVIKVNSELVDSSQVIFVLPIYGYELVTRDYSRFTEPNHLERNITIALAVFAVVTTVFCGIHISRPVDAPQAKACQGYDCF